MPVVGCSIFGARLRASKCPSTLQCLENLTFLWVLSQIGRQGHPLLRHHRLTPDFPFSSKKNTGTGGIGQEPALSRTTLQMNPAPNQPHNIVQKFFTSLVSASWRWRFCVKNMGLWKFPNQMLSQVRLSQNKDSAANCTGHSPVIHLINYLKINKKPTSTKHADSQAPDTAFFGEYTPFSKLFKYQLLRFDRWQQGRELRDWRPNFCEEVFSTPACLVPEKILSIHYLGAAGAPGREVLHGRRKVVHGLIFHAWH